MPLTTHEIRASATDPQLNALLAEAPAAARPLSRHFNQSEEFFVRTQAEYTVPQLAIHHDVRRPEPDPDYRSRLRDKVCMG